MAGLLPRAVPEGRRRLRLRVPPGDPGQGVRRAARHPARGVAVERRHLRHRPGLRGAAAAHAVAPAARGPRLRRPDAHRAAQGDPVVPQAGRPRRSRRRVEHATSRPRGRRWRTSPSGLFPAARRRARAEPRGARSSTSTPTARSSSSRRCSTRTRTCPRHQIEARVRGDDRRRAPRRHAGPTSATAATAATSRAARSSGSSTASTSSPTTARSATCSATACSRSSGSSSQPRARLHPARGRRRWPARPSASTRRWSASRGAARRAGRAVPGAGALRRVAGLQGALRHAAQRPRGDAPHRAAHHAAGPSRPTAWSRQEMHRLIAEQAGHRAVAEMMRFVDHSPEPAARAPRRRAPGRGPPPDPLTPATGHQPQSSVLRVVAGPMAPQLPNKPAVVLCLVWIEGLMGMMRWFRVRVPRAEPGEVRHRSVHQQPHLAASTVRDRPSRVLVALVTSATSRADPATWTVRAGETSARSPP